MKGLLIKDYRLLKNQKQLFVMMLGISIAFGFVYENSFFIISYMTFLLSMFTISTISYDEYDNGMPFLFTLPVSRGIYVTEKYVFGLITAVGSVLLSCSLALLVCLIRQTDFSWGELPPYIFSSLLMVTVLLSVSLPLQLKFGAEKSRVALLLAYGIILLAGYGALLLLRSMGLNVNALLERIMNMGTVFLGTSCLGIAGLLLAISWLASTCILNKRQF